MKEKKEPNIQCHHCNYKWNTRSHKAFVACPDCMYKVRNNSDNSSYEWVEE
jgi:DNA-directed RNA polymerase subunit RPC12/RpoP